jgi:outer membrane protein OmpU
MNRTLLQSGVAACALLGVSGLAAGPAWAEEPIKLSVGGYFKEAYMVVFDDDAEGEFGNERNTDGFFNDAEIHFTGSTILDNGLEVGARVELEGETEEDQIDEAWVFFSGGFGEVRIGSEDDALAGACIVPPGGTGNFSAFSPNQWGANAGALFGEFSSVFSSNSICSGVDDTGDAQKIVYISPSFGGFQLNASYTPNPDRQTHDDGVGPHLGMPESTLGVADASVSAYATYSYEGDGWGLTAGLGGSWEINKDDFSGVVDFEEQDFYQAGLNVSFGNFSLGVAAEYFNDAFAISTPGGSFENDVFVIGGGAAYTMDAWTFGLQYSHRQDDVDIDSPTVDSFDATQDRVVGTVVYALGPGIQLDAELAYTWVDTDPELENAFPGIEDGLDDYQAFEIGLGTSITF